MDSGSAIPSQHGAASSGRGGGSSLPPAGTVVMASVEEDLGEGMYALRWAGTRLAVSSQVRLAPGQSLILKSEISPEGKPTLVVQGPALPEPGAFLGRTLYRPGTGGGNKASQEKEAEERRGPGGMELAAGVAKAAPARLSQPVASLLGLVLEPLEDLDTAIVRLLSDPGLQNSSENKSAEKKDHEKQPAENSGTSSPAPVSDSAAGRGEAVSAGRERPGPGPYLQESPERDAAPFREQHAGGARPPAAVPERGNAAETSPAENRPEVPVREALTQMIKAAELPLISPDADSRALGTGALPDAVADKAAEILLRAAGLTADPASLAAARALIGQSAPVDRQSVQALMALAAGAPEAEREAVLQAAARLLARDIPLAAPLAGGLADVLERREGMHQILARLTELLGDETESELPAVRQLLGGAKDILALMHIDLEQGDAALVLERYLSSFGREALGRSLALVEGAAQAVLEGHPLLPKIDETLTAVLRLLEAELSEEELALLARADPGPASAGAQPAGRPAAEQPPPEIRPGLLPETGGKAPAADSAADADAPRPLPHSPISAYINSPRAFPGLEALSLPPMPKVAVLGPAGAAVPEGGNAAPPLPAPEGTPPSVTSGPAAEKPASDAAAAPPVRPLPPETAALPEQNTSAEDFPALAAALSDSRFQLPGLNRPELELLRPLGMLDRFIYAPPPESEAETVREGAAKLVRALLSDDPEKAAKALRELPKTEPRILRETAARLSRMEAEIVRQDSLLGRLSEAASALRDMGRQLLAVKAENIAGQDRDPGVMLAEVPLRFNDDAGGGRMQMFYRRSAGGRGGWTSRVILDLNTTGMGPLLGDMRFFGQDMAVSVFVSSQETADFLADAGAELVAGLEAKGFRAKTRFMVLPPPPESTGELPEPEKTEPETGSEGTAADGRKKGRLDVKG